MQDNSQRIAELIQKGQKLEAIKLLRETTGVSLKEAKEEIDRLIAALEGKPIPQSQQGHHISSEVRLLAQQGKKIEAIKLLREQEGIGLKEAKELVETLPGGKGGGCVSVLLLLMIAGLGLASFFV